jgi:hypothetical protein
MWEWEIPRMATYKVDNKRRLTLPNSQPGEVYDVEYRGAGSYRLTRLVRQAEAEDDQFAKDDPDAVQAEADS